MTYRISRSGDVFGPYTAEEVQRYMAAGNIVATDLAQPLGGEEWLPVGQLFPLSPVAEPANPGGLPTLYPDPPDLPWWAALLLGVATGGYFFAAWNIYTSSWLRRVDQASTAMYLYAAEAVLMLFGLSNTVHTVGHYMLGQPMLVVHHGFSLGALTWIVRLFARFTYRRELLRHFNGPEPIGLRLSGFLTLLFGGIYFQYAFNRINEIKRTLRVSVPAF